jgi:hypothetical protein
MCCPAERDGSRVQMLRRNGTRRNRYDRRLKLAVRAMIALANGFLLWPQIG